MKKIPINAHFLVSADRLINQGKIPGAMTAILHYIADNPDCKEGKKTFKTAKALMKAYRNNQTSEVYVAHPYKPPGPEPYVEPIKPYCHAL